jgi:hypothetical protein
VTIHTYAAELRRRTLIIRKAGRPSRRPIRMMRAEHVRRPRARRVSRRTRARSPGRSTDEDSLADPVRAREVA